MYVKNGKRDIQNFLFKQWTMMELFTTRNYIVSLCSIALTLICVFSPMRGVDFDVTISQDTVIYGNGHRQLMSFPIASSMVRSIDINSIPEVPSEPTKMAHIGPEVKMIGDDVELVHRSVDEEFCDVYSDPPGIRAKSLKIDQLAKLMYSEGFHGFEGYNKSMMVRIYLSYHYLPLIEYVHEKTGFSQGFLYAYFIYENTYKGRESDLLLNANSIGGVKLRKGSNDYYLAYDDCTRNGKRVKCKFQKNRNLQGAADVWVGVLLQDRYNKCRSYGVPRDICGCVAKAGYHTSKKFQARVNLMHEFWQVKKCYPNEIIESKSICDNWFQEAWQEGISYRK